MKYIYKIKKLEEQIENFHWWHLNFSSFSFDCRFVPLQPCRRSWPWHGSVTFGSYSSIPSEQRFDCCLKVCSFDGFRSAPHGVCLWQAITSGVLAGCSDTIAQKISGVKKLQLRRLLLIMVNDLFRFFVRLVFGPW